MNFSQLVPTELPRDWVELYRSDRIDADALRLSYQRFTSRRRIGQKAHWVRWAFVAALLTASAGVAYAATGVALQRYRASGVSVSHHAAPHGRYASAPLNAGQKTSATIVAPASPSSPTSLARFPELETEASNTPTQATATTIGSRTSSPKGERPRAMPSVQSLPAAEDSPWERAARGLRRGDYRAADIALTEIEANGNTRERESASLSRAQLLMAQGQRLRAIALLRDLSRSTSSASVRAKAEELLRRLEPAEAP